MAYTEKGHGNGVIVYKFVTCNLLRQQYKQAYKTGILDQENRYKMKFLNNLYC